MITNQFGEQYLYAVNRGMFEQESALERIEREFGKLLAREDSLIIFVGSDSGNIIRYVLDRELPAGTRYIFVEPKDILNQVAKVVDLGSVEDRIWLVTPEQLKETAHEASITNYMYVDGVFLKRCLSAEYGFFAQYRSEYWDADSYINDLRWNTLVSLGQDAFIQRQLQNCADNVHPISEIKGCLEGRTVIVLGGGPSLDEHLEWIKAHRKQLVVFAVSRISARLQQVGLEPDFVFSVDPTDMSYQISREMLNFGPDVVFINQYHVVPKLLAQWPHQKFFMGALLPWQSDLNPADVFNGAGPTVTNSAISAAAWLGSRQILLAGVDLCFTSEGYTHAEGSRERAAGPKTDLSSLVLETNSGELANTTPDFASAARNIGLQAIILKGKDVRLINVSARAARMDNVEYQAPDTVSLTGSAEAFKLTFIHRAGDAEGLLRELELELSNKQAQVDEMLVILEQASELHTSMYEGEQINPNRKRELEELDSQLADEYSEVFKLAKMLSVRGLLRMAQSFTEVENLELEQVKQRLDTYYSALREGAKRINQHIVAGLESVNIRLQELALANMDKGAVAVLAHKWIVREEPGRALCVELVGEQVGPFKAAKQAFMNEMQKDQLASLTQQSKLRNLHALPARIQYLKDKGDTEALEGLLDSLVKTEDAQAYLPLIAASIHQMQKQPEAALADLLPVMDHPDSPILEQALAMMVNLCSELGHHQAVMDAMAGLASLNAFYLSLYSDALMANGQAKDAIEHLAEYLHYFPSDKQALIKLKKWYAEQGSEEGVKLVDSLLHAQVLEE
jgi:tetratricopeptide (TPR) repeat protein